MSVLVDSDSRVVVQGITGGEGKFHTRQMVEYGTNVDVLAAPARDGAGDDVRPVLRHLAGVEPPLAAGDALYHDTAVGVDQDAHVSPSA